MQAYNKVICLDFSDKPNSTINIRNLKKLIKKLQFFCSVLWRKEIKAVIFSFLNERLIFWYAVINLDNFC